MHQIGSMYLVLVQSAPMQLHLSQYGVTSAKFGLAQAQPSVHMPIALIHFIDWAISRICIETMQLTERTARACIALCNAIAFVAIFDSGLCMRVVINFCCFV